MQVQFHKNHRLAFTPKPTEEFPKGSPHSDTYKISTQDGSTFTQDAIIVGTKERRHDLPWSPVSITNFDQYSYDSVDQKRHQLGTWVDENQNGVVEDQEVRSFDERIGDVNTNKAGQFAAVTTDLGIAEGENGRWYIREDVGVLKAL